MSKLNLSPSLIYGVQYVIPIVIFIRCLQYLLDHSETANEIVIRSEVRAENGATPSIRQRRVVFITPQHKVKPVGKNAPLY